MNRKAAPLRHAELPEEAARPNATRTKSIPKLNYSIPEACYAAGVGRSTLYEAIGSGELNSIKIGNRRLVPVDALRAWSASKGAA